MKAACPKDAAGPVSLAGLKDLVRRLLPPGSTARSVILAEKDILTVHEVLAKFEIFDRLLVRELAS